MAGYEALRVAPLLKGLDEEQLKRFWEAGTVRTVRTGDTIIKLGQRRVRGLAGIGRALMENRPGDKVNVVVRREGKEIALEVELGTAP